MMNVVVVCLAACLSVVFTEPTSVSWCYNSPSCNDVTWPRTASKDCNGTQQSPIDIVTADVRANANLTALNFTGYDDKTTLTEIKNSGNKIKVHLDHTRMHVEGGGLPGLFASSHFHFHWGNGSAMPGSEHTVDGKRYPMELHVVNKGERNGSVSGDPELILGFFIEASNDIGKPTSWKILTSYLKKIANAGDKAHISHNISMEDLIPGVDRTKYYRYLGSLTSPNCTEGVVWTIFKDPVRVSQDLIDIFATTVYINKTTNSPLMTNTFRGVQPINGRIVTSQVAGTKTADQLPPTGTSTTTAGPLTPTTITSTNAASTGTSTTTAGPLTPTTITSTNAASTGTSAKTAGINAPTKSIPNPTATNPSQALFGCLLSLVLLCCITLF